MSRPLHGITMIPTVDSDGNVKWRTTDIVTINAIAKRLRRRRKTIETWLHDPDFPAPAVQLGPTRGWFWPDVVKYVSERTWPTWSPHLKRADSPSGDVHHS